MMGKERTSVGKSKSKDTLAAFLALGSEIRRLRWESRHWRKAWRKAVGESHRLGEEIWDMRHYLADMERCPKCGSRAVRWELSMSDIGPDREAVLSCGACDCVWQRTGFADFWSGIKDVLEIAGEDADEVSTEEEEGA